MRQTCRKYIAICLVSVSGSDIQM